MFRVIKQIFIPAMLFSCLPNVNSLKCVSLKNQECKLRSEIVNINSNNPMFYPFSIKINLVVTVIILLIILLLIHMQEFVFLMQ